MSRFRVEKIANRLLGRRRRPAAAHGLAPEDRAAVLPAKPIPRHPGWAVALSAPTVEPIRLDPHNPRYFLFRGRPTVLITSGEHYGSVMNVDFDYKKYLRTLAADGLNYTRLFGGS